MSSTLFSFVRIFFSRIFVFQQFKCAAIRDFLYTVFSMFLIFVLPFPLCCFPVGGCDTQMAKKHRTASGLCLATDFQNSFHFCPFRFEIFIFLFILSRWKYHLIFRVGVLIQLPCFAFFFLSLSFLCSLLSCLGNKRNADDNEHFSAIAERDTYNSNKNIFLQF